MFVSFQFMLLSLLLCFPLFDAAYINSVQETDRRVIIRTEQISANLVTESNVNEETNNVTGQDNFIATTSPGKSSTKDSTVFEPAPSPSSSPMILESIDTPQSTSIPFTNTEGEEGQIEEEIFNTAEPMDTHKNQTTEIPNGNVGSDPLGKPIPGDKPSFGKKPDMEREKFGGKPKYCTKKLKNCYRRERCGICRHDPNRPHQCNFHNLISYCVRRCGHKVVVCF